MKIIYEQLSFPTKGQLDSRREIDKIINWLLKNKNHPRYREGIEKAKEMIDENNLMDWFLSKEMDFEVSMEIFNA